MYKKYNGDRILSKENIDFKYLEKINSLVFNFLLKKNSEYVTNIEHFNLHIGYRKNVTYYFVKFFNTNSLLRHKIAIADDDYFYVYTENIYSYIKYDSYVCDQLEELYSILEDIANDKITF